MTVLKLTVSLIVLSALCTCLANGQSIQSQCENSKLQRDQPDVIFSVEKVEVKVAENSSLARTVWFQLRNNTTCKIVLLTPNHHTYFARILKDEKGISLKNANGGLRFERSNDVLDNSETILDVYVYLSNPAKGFHIGTERAGDADNRFTQTLRSGESVLFQLPEDGLKKGRTLLIEYWYEGEKQPASHKAIFNYDQPLKEAINQHKNSK
jgi:hypothetical protein